MFGGHQVSIVLLNGNLMASFKTKKEKPGIRNIRNAEPLTEPAELPLFVLGFVRHKNINKQMHHIEDLMILNSVPGHTLIILSLLTFPISPIMSNDL